MSSASISFPMLGNWSICPPNSFVLFGHTFYWYGVIIACGFLLAVAYCYRRSPSYGIKPDDLTDVLLFAVPLAIVGARVYYVIFFGNYDSFWDMLKIWEGGIAIYGAIIAAVITAFVVCRVKKISLLAVLDVASFGFLIGQFIGRWGNFMNREAYGYETDIFCRMGLTLDGRTVYVHPTFLYESLWNFVGFIALHIISKKTKRKFDGQYFLYYIAWYGLGRVWVEGLRTDSLYIGATDIRVSQVVAAVTCIAAVAIILVRLKSKTCTPENLWVNKVAAMASESSSDAAADVQPDTAADSVSAPQSEISDEAPAEGPEEDARNGGDAPSGDSSRED